MSLLQRDDDDDDGMRDDDVDSDKTVGKSKIQHKYAHIKTKTHKNDDEIENKDSQEDGEAVYEEKDISLEQDELDENKKGRKAKKHKDNKSDEDDEESVNEDERESNTEDLPRMEVGFSGLSLFLLFIQYYTNYNRQQGEGSSTKQCQYRSLGMSNVQHRSVGWKIDFSNVSYIVTVA